MKIDNNVKENKKKNFRAASKSAVLQLSFVFYNILSLTRPSRSPFGIEEGAESVLKRGIEYS